MRTKFKSVLLIDDDDATNFINRKFIEFSGIAESVTVALNGSEAISLLKMLKANQPALILLDINMPVMDGWVFLKEYSKLDEIPKEKTTIYLLTTSVNPDDIETAKQIPVVTGFLDKPLSIDKLKNIQVSAGL
ncbi:MAG: response regulator [Bacteroidia bacterium]|nr:response regulator [Bacteroidia bacterium]